MQPRDKHGNMIDIEKQNRVRRAFAKKISGVSLTEEEKRKTTRHTKRHGLKATQKPQDAPNS